MKSDNSATPNSRFEDSEFYDRFVKSEEKHFRALASSVMGLPKEWALIPVAGKQPLQTNWQKKENVKTRKEIIEYCKGEPVYGIKAQYKKDPHVLKQIEKLGFNSPAVQQWVYRSYATGVGLLTGDLSGGIFAIDVDGASAEPLLQQISRGDLPDTVAWTSNKVGRRQFIYQIATKYQKKLANFSVRVPRSWDELPKAFRDKYPALECKVADGEGLEFRYNLKQSVLPPGIHPTTGFYSWIKEPDTLDAIADAPQWLYDLLDAYLDEEAIEAEEKAKQKAEAEARREHWRANRQQANANSNVPFDATVVEFEQAFDEFKARKALEQVYDVTAYKGDGWHYAECPRHVSTTGTSFQVHEETYQWKCWGCNASGTVWQYFHWRDTGNTDLRGSEYLSVVSGQLQELGLKLPQLKKEYGYESSDYDFGADERDRARDEEEELLAKAQDEGLEKPFDNPEYEQKSKKEKKDEWKNAQFNKRLAEYFDERDLTQAGYPFYVENSHYCSDVFGANMLQNGVVRGLVGIQAGMGKGKTYRIKAWLKSLDKNRQVIFVYSRIALGKSQVKKLSQSGCQIKWIDDTDMGAFKKGQVKKIGLCYDSLHKLADAKLDDNLIVVIDEAESGLTHLLTSSTLSKARGLTLAVFKKLLNTADREGAVLLADATLRKPTIDYVKQFLPFSPVKLCVNTAKPTKRQVELSMGKNGCFLTDLHNAFIKDVKVYFTTDSRSLGQGIHLNFQKTFGINKDDNRFVRLDRDTAKTEKGSEVISDMDGFISDHESEIQVMGSTPTLANGISQELDFFDMIYGHFCGTVTPIEAIQQMARCRHNSRWKVFCKSNQRLTNLTTIADVKKSFKVQQDLLNEMHGEYREFLNKKLANVEPDSRDYNHINLTLQLCEDIREGNFHVMGKEHQDYYYKIVADSNWGKANFTQLLIAELEREGHTIIPREGTETKEGEQVKEAVEEQKRIDAKSIAEADGDKYPSLEIALDVQAHGRTDQEYKDASKSIVVNLTGVKNQDITPEFIYKFKNDRNFYPQGLLYLYVNHPELAIKADVNKLEQQAIVKSEGGQTVGADFNPKSPKVKILIEKLKIKELLPLVNLEDPTHKITNTTPGIKEWAMRVKKLAQKTKDTIASVFGWGKFPCIMTVPKKKGGKSTPKYTSFAKKVLKEIGILLESTKKEQCEYRLSDAFLSDVERVMLNEGLTRKYLGETSEQIQEELVEQIKEAIPVVEAQEAIAQVEEDDDDIDTTWIMTYDGRHNADGTPVIATETPEVSDDDDEINTDELLLY